MPAEDVFAAMVVGLVFVIVGVFMLLVNRSQIRDRELLHAERMEALQKGLPLPPQLLPSPEEPESRPSSGDTALQAALKRLPGNSLKTGVTSLCLGIGVILAFALAQPEWGHWAWGLVLVLVGVGHLIYWMAGGRDEWERGRAFEEEARRRLVDGHAPGAMRDDAPGASGR